MNMTAATAGLDSRFFMSRDAAADVVCIVAFAIVGVALLAAAVRLIRRFQEPHQAVRYTLPGV